MRPGPDSIAPGGCPGGMVLHVYGTDGRLLLESALTHTSDAAARQDANLVADLADDVCLVAFDGDTGRRWSSFDWALAMAFEPPHPRRP